MKPEDMDQAAELDRLRREADAAIETARLAAEQAAGSQEQIERMYGNG